MQYQFKRCLVVLAASAMICGCSGYQPTKNVWKTTKGLWYEYVSPPASVDYDEKGTLPPEAQKLTSSMMGIDRELSRLERVMLNADRPPSQQWLDNLLATFPWLDGFAGVKYDGSILGQQPAQSLKDLDFIPLLYEDKKQNSRALRADVQPGPLGPEIMLAAPLYDGVDFLGIVVAYFDMRSLMRYSQNPEDLVILTPGALLWPGKFDFVATPLAGVNWQKVVVESTSGTCSNTHGSFFYMIRYLGNLPIIFATPEKGDFPTGDGSLEQGYAVFPREREKLPPPPMPERAARDDSAAALFGRSEDEPEVQEPIEEAAQPATPSNEIQPGSSDSMLLRKGAPAGRQIQERQLEGENIEVERVQRPRRPVQTVEEPLGILPDEALESIPGPFGPAEEAPAYQRPSPFGPRREAAPEQEPVEDVGSETSEQGGEATPPVETTVPETESQPGVPQRPSPFGPRPQPAQQPDNTGTAEPEQSVDMADGEQMPGADGEPGPAETEARLAAGDGETKDEQTEEKTEEQPAPRQPATLPGGRPSPFGPRNP